MILLNFWKIFPKKLLKARGMHNISNCSISRITLAYAGVLKSAKTDDRIEL
jgi:hypothetical protein